jgi:hypothetical protein
MLTFYRYADACLAIESRDRSFCRLLVALWPQPAFDGTFPCLDSSATFFLTSLRLAASHAGGTSSPLNQGGKVVLVRWKLLATDLHKCSEENCLGWFCIIFARHLESTGSIANYLGVCIFRWTMCNPHRVAPENSHVLHVWTVRCSCATGLAPWN